MLTSNIHLKGRVQAYLGEILVADFHNLVVTVGKRYVAQRLIDNSMAPIDHIGVGTNGALPSLAQEDLLTPLDGRQAATGVRSGTIARFTASFAAGVATGSLVEAGLFNAAAGGTMLSRVVFPTAIVKPADQALTLVWSVSMI